MIPNVFISSTVADQSHLREAIRDAVIEIGYRPVMSEYGGIGYSQGTSAIQSCFEEVGRSQILVLILGKKYGSLSGDGFSITHKEFRAARDSSIPIITLVDRDVLSFYEVYRENKSLEVRPKYPNMDAPEGTFEMLEEIRASEINNGFHGFSSSQDARVVVKKQLAHLMADLLARHMNPAKASAREILTEMISLRHEMSKMTNSDPKPFLRAMSFIMGESRGAIAKLAEDLFGDLDAAALALIPAKSLYSFLEASGWSISVVQGPIRFGKASEYGAEGAVVRGMNWSDFHFKEEEDDEKRPGYLLTTAKELVINQLALDVLGAGFEAKKSGWMPNTPMKAEVIPSPRRE